METYRIYLGDEMNIYVPQSYQTKCELELLSSTEALIKSGQSSRLLLCICQDALTGGYLMTRGEYRFNEHGKKTFYDKVQIEQDTFNDCIMRIEEWDMDFITKKLNHIRNVLKWKNLNDDILNGHCLLSMLFPDDFEYTFTPNNIKITNGVMISGTLNKQVLADSHASIVHKLDKEYGAKIAVQFVSNFQFIVNQYLITYGFSMGLQDCVLENIGSSSNVEKIKSEMIKCFIEAQSILNTETDEEMKEKKVNNALNNATSIGQKISKESLGFDNNLNCMILAGSKGSYVNIAQITGIIGQQNVDGKRIPKNFGNRTLPHYFKNDSDYLNDKTFTSNDKEIKLLEQLFESRGFITSSYIKGINPKQLFFHAAGGREGVIDTAIKTAKSGYIQRKLVKKMEDLKVSYNGFVTNAKDNIIQFNYGDSFDPSTSVKINTPTNGTQISFVNIKNISKKINEKYEYENKL
jgi:DNA-directed RNA polymerase II subunit RPB1